MQDKITFGKFLRGLREEKNMTQKEAAKQLYVTDKAVSKWETGSSYPDISLFEKIADLYGITIIELMKCERDCRQEVPAEEVVQLLDSALSHSGRMLKHAKSLARRAWTAFWLLSGLLPIAVLGFSALAFYLIKEEANLDEALLTLAFLCLAAFLFAVRFSPPVILIVLISLWRRKESKYTDRKLKKRICLVLYTFCIGYFIYQLLDIF